MSASPAYLKFKTSFQLSPIILTGGIASAQGGGIPIINLTSPGSGVPGNTVNLQSLANSASGNAGTVSSQLDRYFFNWDVVQGGTLINNQIAKFPFLNQAVAANAIIAQPLNISLRATCPAGDQYTWAQKASIISALQATLSQHNNLGGLYTVCTPGYIYQNCILVLVRDVSGNDTKQPQYAWQFDFEQPLVSLQAATQAQNNLMSQFTKQTPTTGNPSWPGGLAVGNPSNVTTNSLVSPALSSAAVAPPGS
jgi:hypothetical protein